jgi:hypothetical protein
MRITAGYNLLYHSKNEDILEQLKLVPVENTLAQCKQKWLNHVSRVEDIQNSSSIFDLSEDEKLDDQ